MHHLGAFGLCSGDVRGNPPHPFIGVCSIASTLFLRDSASKEGAIGRKCLVEDAWRHHALHIGSGIYSGGNVPGVAVGEDFGSDIAQILFA